MPQNEALISKNTSVEQTRQCNSIRNCGWYVTLLAIGGASAVVFYDQYSKDKEDGVIEQYAISGGCTAVIQKVVVPLVCLPTARVLMSKVQETRLGTWLGFHRRIDTHKVIAGLFGAAAATHTVCSVLGDPQFLETQEGKTGTLMWSALLVPLFGSYILKDTPCLRKLGYGLRFLHPHQLGFLLFAGGYSLHRPGLELLPWVAIPLGELAFDRFIEFASYRYKTTVTDARIEGDKIILSIARPSKMKIEEGQFVYLKMGGRYHPFTIAWHDDENLSFVISPSGPGTRALYEQIQEGNFPSPSPITLRGPFNSPFQSIKSRPQSISISSGSGVSVSMSRLQKLMNEKSDETVTLLHSERHPESFSSLIESINLARMNGVSIKEVHLFLTSQEFDFEKSGGSLSQMKQRIEELGMGFFEVQPNSYQELESVVVGEGINVDSGNTPQIFLHRGRLNLARSLSDNGLRADLMAHSGTHVLIAGNPKLAKMTEDFCIDQGLEYTKEAFQF